MSHEIDQQEIAKRYLLGELSAEERERFEEQYFFDDAEFEQLEIAEDELIERYVQEELSVEEKRRFEKLLVSPGISERVEVARMLAGRTVVVPQVVTPPAFVPVTPVSVGWWERLFGPAAAIPAFRPAFAMSMIFMLLTTVALVFVWMKLRTESQRLAQEQQQREQLKRDIDEQKARYDQLAAKLDKSEQEKQEQAALAAEYKRLAEAQQRSVAAMIYPVFLNPGGGSRGPGGEAIKEFSIPSGASQVGLKLNVTHGGDDYPQYNASVKNIDSKKQLTTQSNIKPYTEGGRKYITVNVAAKTLLAGSYSVHVDGVTASGQIDDFEDYLFRVNSR